MKNIELGQYVEYNNKEYICDGILIDPESFNEKIVLINDNESILIDCKDVNVLDKFNDNIIKNGDKVLYNGIEYTVQGKFNDRHNLKNNFYALKNNSTGDYVTTGSIDNSQIQKIKE